VLRGVSPPIETSPSYPQFAAKCRNFPAIFGENYSGNAIKISPRFLLDFSIIAVYHRYLATLSTTLK
jgi:hypothetical protein